MGFFDDFGPIGKIVGGICLIAAAPIAIAVTIPVVATVAAVAVTAGTVTTAAAITAGACAAEAAGLAVTTIGTATIANGVSEASK